MRMSVKSALAKAFFDFAYAIAYRPIPNTDADKTTFPKGENEPFHLLKPTLRFWYADPLLAEINGKDILFMEIFDRKKKKGFIGVSSFTESGKLTSPKGILEEEFHLSFPVIFTYQNRYILMPECSEALSLRFYELNPVDFSVKLLREFPTGKKLVDTVVLSQNGDEITLLSCEENPDNPKQTSLVMLSFSDLFSSDPVYQSLPPEYASPSFLLRNGGPVYMQNNKKIRILQQSTETEYGHNLIFRTVSDEPGNYQEEDLSTLYLEDLPLSLPVSYRKQGTHTYSMTSLHEVIDVSFNRFHIGNLFYQ